MPQRIRGDRCFIFHSGDLVRPLPKLRPKKTPPEIDTSQWRSSLEDSVRIEVLAAESVVNEWYGRHDRLTLEITMPCLKKDALPKEQRYAVQAAAIGAGFLPLSMRHLQRDLLPTDYFELKVWRCYQPSSDFCHILESNLNGTINYWSQLEKRWIFEARSIPAQEYCLMPKRYREKIPESVVKVLN